MARSCEINPRSRKSISSRGILALWISATEEAEFWSRKPEGNPFWGSLEGQDDRLCKYLNALIGRVHSEIGVGSPVCDAEVLQYCVRTACSLPASALDETSIRTLWGSRLSTPWGVNTYRQFLKRMSVGNPSHGSLANLMAYQTNPLTSEQASAMRDLHPYIRRVPFTMQDALDISFNPSYSFGPGATSDRPAAIAAVDSSISATPNVSLLVEAGNDIRCESSDMSHPKSKQGWNDVQVNTSLEHLLLLDTDNDVAHVCFVPKDWKSERLITPHPGRAVLLQSQLEAAFLAALERYKVFPPKGEEYSYLGPVVGGDRVYTLSGAFAQLPNRLRCNLFYDTIDLTQASDSVTVSHCMQCLDPEWFARFYKSRIIKFKYPLEGSQFNLERTMFPMGAKACFKVETCVFDTYVRAILRKEGAPGWVIQDARTFGDDIIVPHGWGDVVIEWLEKLGFTVNRDKSYTRGCYRETCGRETYDSIDITPVRLPRGAKETWLFDADQSTMVDFARTLDENGLYITQALFLELCDFVAYECLPRRKGSSQIDCARLSKPRKRFPITVSDDPGVSHNSWVSLPFINSLSIADEVVYSPVAAPSKRTYVVRRTTTSPRNERFQAKLQLLSDRCQNNDELQRLVVDYLISQVKGSWLPGKTPSRSSLLPRESTYRTPKVRVLVEEYNRFLRGEKLFPSVEKRVTRR